MLRPTDTVCPVCQNIFQQPQRPQGGGRRTIYCSHKCAAKDWARGNGKKRKATVLRYEGRPENKEKRRQRARIRTLEKYGWTEREFQFQLGRQNRTCYGCLDSIDETTARIDHCHETNRIRGLLCDSCNWALGHAFDTPATLRRLMAYLDYQREKLNVYLIGALKNERIPDVGNLLRTRGFDVMDEWFTPGEFADTNWQAYEKKRGRTYQEALKGRAATNIFLFDQSYLDHCDVAIVVAPAGKSAMIEVGYAKGRGKKTILFLDGQEPDRYDIMPNIIDKVCKTEDDLLQELGDGTR